MTGAYTFDTSGEVILTGADAGELRGKRAVWSDLTPFQQGYTEAAFLHPMTPENWCLAEMYGFSDLAPEALALILKDCEEGHPLFQRNAAGGRRFWITRQLNGLADFPPLIPFLFDDGKVHLREKGQ